jgi:hypothetical protein
MQIPWANRFTCHEEGDIQHRTSPFGKQHKNLWKIKIHFFERETACTWKSSSYSEHVLVWSEVIITIQNMTYPRSRGWLYKIKPEAIVWAFVCEIFVVGCELTGACLFLAQWCLKVESEVVLQWLTDDSTPFHKARLLVWCWCSNTDPLLGCNIQFTTMDSCR